MGGAQWYQIFTGGNRCGNKRGVIGDRVGGEGKRCGQVEWVMIRDEGRGFIRSLNNTPFILRSETNIINSIRF